MPVGLENKDSSFFQIESTDIILNETDFNRNLISLTITENTGALPNGTLTFYDPDHSFSKILRTGVSLRIAWGYKNFLTTPSSLLANTLNFDEVTGPLVRRGFEGFVSSPTGSGGVDGVVKYNCNFTSWGFRGLDKVKKYTEGKKKDVISQAFDDIGISPIKRYIDFTLGDDPLTENTEVRQMETSFAFLKRKALEWQATFHVSFSPLGESVGVFIDRNKIGSTMLPAWVLSAGGGSNAIDYKGKLNNVKSYKWSSSESENGSGDNVSIEFVDGQIQFRRYTATQESVITYRFNLEELQKDYETAALDGLSQQYKLFKELYSAKDFESIKHYFIAEETTTAPDGYGYRINAEMIGNPLYIPGNRIQVLEGFPSRIGGAQSIWYLNSVTHVINSSGYNMSIEVVDVFNLSPIGLPVI